PGAPPSRRRAPSPADLGPSVAFAPSSLAYGIHPLPTSPTSPSSEGRARLRPPSHLEVIERNATDVHIRRRCHRMHRCRGPAPRPRLLRDADADLLRDPPR